MQIRTGKLSMLGFSTGSLVKNLPASAGDLGLIPGSGRSPGEGNGKLLQYSCPENSMNRKVWGATVHGGLQSMGSQGVGHVLATKQLSVSMYFLQPKLSTTALSL